MNQKAKNVVLDQTFHQIANRYVNKLHHVDQLETYKIILCKMVLYFFIIKLNIGDIRKQRKEQDE